MQHMTTSDGITIHHGDDRLGQTTDLHLHIEHTQTGHAIFINIATTTFYVHVSTRTKGMLYIGQSLSLRHLRHRSCEQHYRNVLHLATHAEGLRQFPSGLGGKGVTVTGTIDGNLGNTIIFLEEDLFKHTYFFPVSHILNDL